MSAPRRRSNNNDDSRGNRIERLSRAHEFQKKLCSITTLQAGHWEGQHYLRELTVLACRAVSPHQGRPEALERNWASNTGKPWKTLKEFPERLIRMADEVERINAGDPAFFARRPQWNVDRNESSNLREVCEQLPASMRSYAKALRERNSYVAKVTPRSGRLNALLDLSEIVKLLTGGYRDRQVAELLNAAADTLHERAQFDALNIAQARSRRRKNPRA